MRAIILILSLACLLAQPMWAADGETAKKMIGGSDFPMDVDDVDLDIPMHYRREDKATGQKMACIAYFDTDAGTVIKECCRKIISDTADKYAVESSSDHQHCRAPHSVGSINLSGKGKITPLMEPGVCNNYHGVGNDACSIYTSGSYSYVWCVSNTDPSKYDAEVYRGAAGIDHIFNIIGVTAGSCPGT